MQNYDMSSDMIVSWLGFSVLEQMHSFIYGILHSVMTLLLSSCITVPCEVKNPQTNEVEPMAVSCAKKKKLLIRREKKKKNTKNQPANV